MISPVLIAQLGILGFVFVMLLSSSAIMVYVDRKVAAKIQQRMGPWLVGPYGWLRPLADVVKLMVKAVFNLLLTAAGVLYLGA